MIGFCHQTQTYSFSQLGISEFPGLGLGDSVNFRHQEASLREYIRQGCKGNSEHFFELSMSSDGNVLIRANSCSKNDNQKLGTALACDECVRCANDRCRLAPSVELI